MRRGLRAVWPVVLWMALILVATSIPVPRELGRAVGGPVDKLVHLGLYFGLGWTGTRALDVLDRLGVLALVAALLAGFAFAALDEWHQTLLLGRAASLADWLADVAGLLLGTAAYLWRVVRAEATPSRS